jgi:DNA-binding NarL/FixJ family response regulator
LQVLRLLARGGTSRTVAAELSRSPLTIDSHVKAIVKKIGCRGRLEAVALARERGIA